MTRPTFRGLLDTLALIERRARGMEPGDDALSRLRLTGLSSAPGAWLRMTAAKLAVVVIMAMLIAALFAGGIAVMRALGIEH